MENKKFYLTTAIAYTSSKPHIGNAYDIVLADMIARYKRMQGFDVYFLTGSDEHGQKIQQKAEERGITPKAYVDEVAGQIKTVWDKLNTSYDRFIRTTDDDHEAAIGAIFKKLYDNGDIYKGKYEGKYCIPCESFFTPSQLKDGKCPDCGREVVDASEEAYFLRLSKYQDRLLQYFEENPDFIQPESRRNEMINNFLKPGLSDLCVSRSSFSWGIPVPTDEKHVIYVWIDALCNYITGVGYHPDAQGELFAKNWPADLHVIGKDIVRFHTIYWPIILMALGLPLPKQVLGHPWLLSGEDKMSKSRGNVLYADNLADRFGTDAVRYYLLSQIPFAQDGTITLESFLNLYNADLANTLGNLVNRSIAMTNKYFGGTVSANGVTASDADADLIATAKTALAAYAEKMDCYHNAEALAAVMSLAKRCNKYIDETTPWSLAKDESARAQLETVLYNLLECIRLLTVCLRPVLPETADRMATQLQLPADALTLETLSFGACTAYTVGTPEPLFARLDVEAVLAEDAAAREAEAVAEEEPTVAFLSEIGIDDFAKVDLRVARVTACEPVKKSKKLLKLTLDDGSGTPRTVASGIALWYTPEDLIGHSVVVVANLKPVKLCGVESNGMILAADDGDAARVIFVDGMKPGSQIH